jgi:type IV pilus assembly protein PilE
MFVLNRRMQGFTLIEMMIVVAVIGILAAVAYPSYAEYVKRSNRSEGQALLSDTAAAQERYYSQNNRYITANADMAKLKARSSSTTNKYTLTVSSMANDGGYSLTATPQFSDTDCGNLTLNALGVRERSGSKKTATECWR